MEAVYRGNNKRAVDKTFMNAFSSRSHAIVQLAITKKLFDQLAQGVAAGIAIRD